jgi:hypothetical protein
MNEPVRFVAPLMEKSFPPTNFPNNPRILFADAPTFQ